MFLLISSIWLMSLLFCVCPKWYILFQIEMIFSIKQGTVPWHHPAVILAFSAARMPILSLSVLLCTKRLVNHWAGRWCPVIGPLLVLHHQNNHRSGCGGRVTRSVKDAPLIQWICWSCSLGIGWGWVDSKSPLQLFDGRLCSEASRCMLIPTNTLVL